MLNAIQNVLVVGASSGVGLACVRLLHHSGRFRIFSASRSSNDELEKLTTYIEADVTNDDSVQRMVQRVLDEGREIHVLIHAAGYSLSGAIEDTTIEESHHQFETNFWGVVRVNKAVLPKMREAGRGTIINIGSIAGMLPLPFQAYYSASKAALESFCDVLQYEVRPFGLRVHLVQPGDLKTNLTQNRRYALASLSESPYTGRFERCIQSVKKMESNGQSPNKVARTVLKLASNNCTKLRYRVAHPLEEVGLLIRQSGFHNLYNRLARFVFGD